MPACPGAWTSGPPCRAPSAPSGPSGPTPHDRVAEDDARVTLARAVVDQVRRMIDQEVAIPGGEGGAMRPVRAGDVLILVRSRDALFHEIIRRAKAREIPVAGADRLRVGGELAVRDIASLLAYLALPQDDLSLAEALRSPLMGWSERELYDLAHRRPAGRTLDEALRARAAESPRTDRMLRALRDDVDFLRPYDLIERILTRHEGRARLIARLGPEAEEGIDALLNLALAYERLEVPTLTGFVSWLSEDASEIKRQAEGAGELMRVMTVHGAKGLEAPIVILPQTDDARPPRGGALAPSPAGPIWAPTKAETPPALRGAMEAARAADEAERLRLLYVAMTRAETWLIVAGARSTGDGSWHARAEGALGRLGAVATPFPTGEGLRFETGDWSGAAAPRPPAAAAPRAALPDWALRPPPPRPRAAAPALALGARRRQGAARRGGRRGPRRRSPAASGSTASWSTCRPSPTCRPWRSRATCCSRPTRPRSSPTSRGSWPRPGRSCATPRSCRSSRRAPAPRRRWRPRSSSAAGRGPCWARWTGSWSRPSACWRWTSRPTAGCPRAPRTCPRASCARWAPTRRRWGRSIRAGRIETAVLWTAAPRLMPLPARLVAAALERAEV